MGKILKQLLAVVRLLLSTMKEFTSSVDNVNTAWRQGKALENFQMTIQDNHELRDASDMSVRPQSGNALSKAMNVVIVTERVPTRFALLKITRSLQNVNRRYGTHISAQIIHRAAIVEMRRAG